MFGMRGIASRHYYRVEHDLKCSLDDACCDTFYIMGHGQIRYTKTIGEGDIGKLGKQMRPNEQHACFRATNDR